MHYQAAFVDEIIFSKSNFSGNEGSRLLNPFTIDLVGRGIDSNAKNNEAENRPDLRFLLWLSAFSSRCTGNKFKNIPLFFDLKNFLIK